ncbi:MAG: transglycosylase SLT domain-containing protein [Treponema sp.]|jgi:hypothetical protein|nr:transglycosylase SLT domain-containing protein [Treponema sp.]
MTSLIAALVLSIASEVGVPPFFALSVALEENCSLNPNALNKNPNGTFDGGVMQLNSSWFTGDWEDPESNIRAGCLLIKELMGKPEITTFWDVAIAYQCGYTRFLERPPSQTIEYACRVYARWHLFEGPYFQAGALKKQ